MSRSYQQHFKRLAQTLLLLTLATASNAQQEIDRQLELPGAPPGKATFKPPRQESIPDNPFGQMVKRGQELFVDTQQLHGQYVGNKLNCVNCHLDRGRLADSAPMWAAYVKYPAYRKKNNKVNTLAERIQGCFSYSMNGAPPPPGSEPLEAMQTYFYWLATGAPVGVDMKGRGYPKLAEPAMKPDIKRGAAVYKTNCAICHGGNGEGQSAEGRIVFPPLWGQDSYNWGAGMHRVNTAAAFIKANMPLGQPYSLTDQEAWDVAAFINSHERPQDPRFNGNLEQTRKKYHDHNGYYGKKLDGALLGKQAYPNPLAR